MKTFKDYHSVHEILREAVEKRADKNAYKWFNDDKKLESSTWKQFYEQVQQISKSLIALGVKKNDKVNILSYTCYKWVLADLGTTCIGSCTVGIYQSSMPEDCKYIINHSDAVVIFAEDESQLTKILEIKNEIPNIKKVILFKGTAGNDDWVISFNDFLELGEKIPEEDLAGRIRNVSQNDTAAIVYTSGTTGKPKGAELTHDNIASAVQSLQYCHTVKDYEEGFLFLPLAHIFARLTVYFCIYKKVTMIFVRSLDTIIEDMQNSRPHFFPAVPRIFEKAYFKIINGAESKGGLASVLFKWAFKVGADVVKHRLAKQPVSFLDRIKFSIADKLIFKKIQNAFGGRVEWCISGGAPLSPRIKEFFYIAGITILEGLGMTENMSFSNLSRINNYRFDWIGPPGPGIEQKLAEDGEIIFRGRNVMKGYYKMPEETAKTLSEDGWLHTGDLGEIDSDNFLRVIGRKKDLIITSGGKNIAPTVIEEMLGQSKLINQVCVIGDQKNYLTALIVPDLDVLNTSDIKDQTDDVEIRKMIEHEIEAVNKKLASFERIKKFSVVDEFTIENSLLTPTLKIRKSRIFDRYKNEINDMYV